MLSRRSFLLASACALLASPALGVPNQPTRDFTLKDSRGRTRRLADFRGKVVVLTFGYTQCPDVCPMTLSVLAQTMAALGEEARRVQVIFVTVDPDRDDARLMGLYVPAFNPSFLGLRGDRRATARAASVFDVEYRKVPGKTPRTYTVDHTATSYILDPDGVLRVVVGYGQGPEVFERDIRRLLAAFPAA